MSATAPTALGRLPPGPPPRDGGVGGELRHAWTFFRDPIGVVGGRFGRYGDVYFVPGDPDGLYVLRHPEHLREVLITRADDYEKKHSAFTRLERVLGQGLLTTDGEVWRRHRRLLAPAFGKRAIEGYVPAMAAAASAVADKIRPGQSFDAGKLMVELTLGVVGSALLGLSLEAEVARVGAAMRSFQLALAVPESAPWLVRAPADQVVARASAELDDVIRKVIDTRARAAAPHPDDLLQMLLDATDPENPGDRLSPKEIRDELVTFLLAGHETTSNVLAWTLYLLSQSPEVEARLHAEVDAVLGGRAPRGADVEALRYTEQIVKEAMRLYPPAYVLVRRAVRDTRVGEWQLPAGAELALWIYFTHHDERTYPDPGRFDPDRFTPEREAARHKQAYLPFGAGPRACIGRAFALTEAVVVLAELARRFSFRYHGRRAPALRPRLTLGPIGLQLVARSRR